MNIPGFKMPAEKIVVSKGMLAGIGCIVFGGYLILKNHHEFGWAMCLYGFSVLGIRDAQ